MRSVAAAFGVLVGLTVGSGAAAAPQILGLTASAAPIPFVCDAEQCAAFAGTFCLQRERDIPGWRTPYQASHPERLTLLFRDRAGGVARLPGGPWVRFAAYNGYSMVRMIVPRALLDSRGAAAVTLEIGPGISLLPTPQAGDSDPQSAEEIALAAGPLRRAAASYLDQPSATVDTARLLAQLIGALPERRTIHDDYSGLWPATVTDDLTGQFDAAALTTARGALERCREETDLRRCLLTRHRALMTRDNARYWDGLVGY
jgi:hypothetical protein